MRLALGTVQFGLNYGVSNASGRTPRDEVERIFEAARAHGVDILDTAASYGDAEDVLASLGARQRGFRIVTKTARIAAGLAAVEARARQSFASLGRPVDALLVHSARDLLGDVGPTLWSTMEKMRGDGDVARIGISFYQSDPIREMAQRFRPQVVQLPASLLDQRLIRDGTLRALADDGIEIHVRSAFHQGLIFVDPDRLPEKLRSKRETVVAMQKSIAATGVSPVKLALSFLASVREISAIVVGVTKAVEFEEIAAAMARPVTGISADPFALNDPQLLDPTLW